MSSKSFRASGLHTSLTTFALRLLALRQSRSRLPSQFVKVERLRGTAGLAQAAEAFDVFLAQIAFELPIADGLPHDLARCRIFTGSDGRFESRELLARQGDAHLLDIGQNVLPMNGFAKLTTKWQKLPQPDATLPPPPPSPANIPSRPEPRSLGNRCWPSSGSFRRRRAHRAASGR